MNSGFISQTFDSQAVFRQLLDAMAHPGTIREISVDLTPETPLHEASGAVLLTLMDFETPFWSDLDFKSPGVQWLRFHTGAPLTSTARQAGFALVTDYDKFTTPDMFNCGTAQAPDFSCTLIIHTRGMDDRGRIRMTGPGIQREHYVNIKGPREVFFTNRTRITHEYPLGIDMIFVCERQLMAVPRTTRMEVI